MASRVNALTARQATADNALSSGTGDDLWVDYLRRNGILTAPPVDLMPIAWGDPTNQPAQQQKGFAGITPDALAEIKRQMGFGGSGIAETEIPIPTWSERLGLTRPVTADADPGMVVTPRRADVDSLYGNTGFVAPGDLRPLPANTPVAQLPSYRQGTDYVPEDGPARLHEGEMVVPKKQADAIRGKPLPDWLRSWNEALKRHGYSIVPTP